MEHCLKYVWTLRDEATLWNTSHIWSLKLEVDDRKLAALTALFSLDAIDALEVMEYVSVQHQFGAPLPPLGNLKDEAEWWVTRPQRDELQCYLLAIFMALPKQLQLDFTDFAQKYCNERQFL